MPLYVVAVQPSVDLESSVKFAGFVFAASAALLAIAPAQAAITTSQTLSGVLGPAFLLPNGFSRTLNFDPFSNPGETLIGVTLSFSTGYSSNFLVTNPGNIARTITLSTGIAGTLEGNGFNLAGNDVVTKTNTVNRVSFRSFGNYSPTATGTDSLVTGLNAFTGPGLVSFAFNARQFGNDLTGVPNLGLTTVATNLLNADSFYTATLTYTSQVPEPGTWVMLLGGFAMVGGAARRRAATVAA
jgi:hypothetical protein